MVTKLFVILYSIFSRMTKLSLSTSKNLMINKLNTCKTISTLTSLNTLMQMIMELVNIQKMFNLSLNLQEQIYVVELQD